MSSGAREKSRRGKHKPNQSIDTGNWRGFVDIPLSPEEREEVQGMADSGVYDVFDLLQGLMEEGYKLSISPHKEGRSAIASLTGRLVECPNYGYTLSAWGPNMHGALVSLLYKHFQLCGAGVWAEQPHTTRQQMMLWG